MPCVLALVVVDNLNILDLTWFTDMAWFNVFGYINSQNMPMWAAEHPHEICESAKIDVWCMISQRYIIGSIFFDSIVTCAVYVETFHAFVNQFYRKLAPASFNSMGRPA